MITVQRDASGRARVGVAPKCSKPNQSQRVGRPALVVVQGATVVGNRVGGAGLGASNFYTPTATQWAANPPASAATDASTMLTYFASNGVPYEGTVDGSVQTFQTDYNSEPAVSGLNDSKALLTVDGKYGPDTRTALASVIAAAGLTGTAPAPNLTAPGGSPAPSPPSPAPGPSIVTNNFAGMPVWAAWAVGLAAVGGAAVVANAGWKKHGATVKGHARHMHARLQHHARRLTHRHA